MSSRYYLAYPRKLMSCVSVLGAFHVNTASTASGSGLTPCLSTILPRYLIECLRISHFDGLHFKPTLFMHPRTSSSRSMWSSRVGVANTSQDYRTSLSLWSKPEPSVFEKWPLRCTTEGHPLPMVQPQLTRESGLFSILLPQRDLPEGRTQVQCGEELGITKFREALVYSRYRVRIFYRYRVQVAKVATKPKLPPFFFAIAIPQAHGDFEGSIMSYSSNISISARHASNLCGVIRLRLPYGERRLPLVRFRVRRSYSNRYVLKIHPRSDPKSPEVIQNLPRLISLLSVLSMAKLVCQTVVHMTRGVPKNSSSSMSRRPCRTSLKTIYE